MKIYKNIIDVRAPWEFESGHVEGSINIPLDQIQIKLEEIQKMEQPILMCCQSGKRSGVAAAYLDNMDVVCINGGGWEDVNAALNNQKIALDKGDVQA